MKRSLLLLTVFWGLLTTARAQSPNPSVWCPPGAQWVYDAFSMLGSYSLTIRYAADTVVGGQAAQVLRRTFAPAPATGGGAAQVLRPTITRVVGDQVEVWDGAQFHVLYNFAARPGDTWLTPPASLSGSCSQIVERVTVDSVGRQMVGNRSLRWLRVHLTLVSGFEFSSNWRGRIYELAGNVGAAMQPQSYPNCGGSDPVYMGPLVSYQAAGMPTVRYNAANGTLLATTESRSVAAGFDVFPNPSSGICSVKLPTQLTPGSHLTLVDMAGRQVREFTAGQQIDLHGLRAGAYTLLLRAPKQATLARRLMLE